MHSHIVKQLKKNEDGQNPSTSSLGSLTDEQKHQKALLAEQKKLLLLEREKLALAKQELVKEQKKGKELTLKLKRSMESLINADSTPPAIKAIVQKELDKYEKIKNEDEESKLLEEWLSVLDQLKSKSSCIKKDELNPSPRPFR